MDEAVEDSSFWRASEADMQRWLRSICIEPTGESQTAKEIVKGITLNHLQMTLLIKKIDRSNFWTQIGFAIIAFVALGLSAFQIMDSRRQRDSAIGSSVMRRDTKADEKANNSSDPKPLDKKVQLTAPSAPNSLPPMKP